MYCTLLGQWQECNKFITEDNEILKVFPMSYVYSIYKHRLPLDCFIILDKDTIIFLIPIEEFVF